MYTVIAENFGNLSKVVVILADIGFGAVNLHTHEILACTTASLLTEKLLDGSFAYAGIAGNIVKGHFLTDAGV